MWHVVGMRMVESGLRVGNGKWVEQGRERNLPSV